LALAASWWGSSPAAAVEDVGDEGTVEGQEGAPAPTAAAGAVADTDRGFPASALQLGGGVAEFTLGPMRSQTTRGPYWDLRSVIDALILRNGIEAGPRLNVPVERKDGLVLLYGTIGLGLSNYRLVRSNAPGMLLSDWAATVPLAAGMTLGYRRILFDVRIGYRFTFHDQLLGEQQRPSGSVGSPPENRLRDYSFGVQIGYEV
jgi:hypothetical protein